MSEEPRRPRDIPLEAKPDAMRAPRAFALGPEPGAGRTIRIEEAAEEDPFAPPPEPEKPAREPLFTWTGLVWSAFALLAGVYLVDAGWSFLVSLETKSPWVARIALGLMGIVALGLLGFLGREMLALLRMRKVTGLRIEAAECRAAPDDARARRLAGRLSAFYAGDATATAGRAEIARALGEIHDPETLLAIAERGLLAPRDALARQMIAEASQRVSVVTALSPRAIVDIAFVLAQSVALIRKLSALYGGRASGFGLWRLTTRVASHLAVTGGMAVADSLVGQFLGAGLAARLSAKLGEGVLNGVLTARVGIAAVDLCRPLPFQYSDPILLSEVAKNVFSQE